MAFYNVYSDESRQNAHRFMLFGALFVERGPSHEQLSQRIAEVRRKRRLSSEMKWSKVSRGMLDSYREFMDTFFDSECSFRCLVIDTHKVNLRMHHENDRELAFYNFYFLMLASNMRPSDRYLVLTDERDNRERNRLSDLKDRLNSHWRLNGAETDVVANVEPRGSKASDELQLVDLLLGATGYAIEEYTTSEAKLNLVRHVEGRLGTDNLRAHRGSGSQFSVWIPDLDEAGQAKSRPDP